MCPWACGLREEHHIRIHIIGGFPTVIINVHPALVRDIGRLPSIRVRWRRFWALLDSLIFAGPGGLAAFRPASLALRWLRIVQLAGGIQALLSRVPSQSREYLCDPADEKATRPVCLCAFWEATGCGWWRSRDSTKEGQCLAYLIHDQHGVQAPQQSQQACLLSLGLFRAQGRAALCLGRCRRGWRCGNEGFGHGLVGKMYEAASPKGNIAILKGALRRHLCTLAGSLRLSIAI
jgi:hypothetical protein